MPTGWEITVQLASLLKIATPFHAILCANGEKIAPFQTLEKYIVNGICELTFVLRQVRSPSVRQYESLIGAIQFKEPDHPLQPIRPRARSQSCVLVWGAPKRDACTCHPQGR